MRRLVATMATLFMLSGCGGSEDQPPAPTTASASVEASPSPAPEPGTVSRTDGRLGDATVAGPDRKPEVKPGGKLDPKPRKREGNASGVAGSGSCEGADLQPSAENVAPVAAATLCLVNEERAAVGLAALRTNDLLAQAAQVHGDSMVKESYFSHTGSDGSDATARVKRTGYTKGEWLVGENLAWGSGSLAEPRSIVVSWMNSQGHRENMLRSAFEEIGVAVVPGNPKSGDGGGTFVTVFGKSSGGGSDGGSGAEPPAEQPSGEQPSGEQPSNESQGSAGSSSSAGSRQAARRRCRNLPRKRRARCLRAARR